MDIIIRENNLTRHVISRCITFAILNYSHENISRDCARCIRGYHVFLYGVIRTAVMGEQLLCERKLGPRSGLNVIERR